ncbi:MAG: sodium transporter, partial [bacterium]
SLDSTLNSLSATTMNDLILPLLEQKKIYSDAKVLLFSRLTTIFWGLFAIVFAFLTGAISQSVIVAINKIGSLFYGSIAAAFLVGLLTKKAGGISVRIGIVAGVLFNFILWKFAPGVSWLWWNFFGFAITFGLAWIFGDKKKLSYEFNFSKITDWIERPGFWKKSIYLLFGFGIIIILITYALPYIF